MVHHSYVTWFRNVVPFNPNDNYYDRSYPAPRTDGPISQPGFSGGIRS